MITFNVLDIHKKIRSLPKPVIAMVNGYAIGGGHVLHVVCDLTLASENAIFGQTGPKVGSFDGGFGAGYLARLVGQRKAREIWFLCRRYGAKEALEMGLINDVVPIEDLEREGVRWAKEVLKHSPTAIRCRFHDDQLIAADTGMPRRKGAHNIGAQRQWPVSGIDHDKIIAQTMHLDERNFAHGAGYRAERVSRSIYNSA